MLVYEKLQNFLRLSLPELQLGIPDRRIEIEIVNVLCRSIIFPFYFLENLIKVFSFFTMLKAFLGPMPLIPGL